MLTSDSVPQGGLQIQGGDIPVPVPVMSGFDSSRSFPLKAKMHLTIAYLGNALGDQASEGRDPSPRNYSQRLLSVNGRDGRPTEVAVSGTLRDRKQHTVLKP